MLKLRSALKATAMSLPIAMHAAPAGAEQFPQRRVTVIAPFPAGASADAAARILTQKFGELLGQPFVVENRTGALGEIGVREMLKASPDGYTICFCNDGSAITVPAAYTAASKPPPYTPADFTAVGQAVEIYFLLVVRKDLPVNNFAELVSYIRANPGKLNVASGNPMSTIFTGLMKHLLGTEAFLEVPYGGNEPKAMLDLIGGRVDVLAATSNNALPQIESGDIRVLGALGEARNPYLPDVRTLEEQTPELADFHKLVRELKPWNGFLGPKGMPDNVVAVLGTALKDALLDPEVQSALKRARLGVHYRDRTGMENLFNRLPVLVDVMKQAGTTIVQ